MLLYSHLILLLLLYYISVFVEPFTPEARFAHSSTLVGTNLYFFGGLGAGEDNSVSTQTFYLDVSKPFNRNNLSWTIAKSSIPVAVSYAQTFGGKSKAKNKIFLYGGDKKDPAKNLASITENSMYTFDIRTETWNTLGIDNIPPPRRKFQIPTDDSGEAYLFGGQNETFILKDMNVFNTNTLVWNLDISVDDFTSPFARSDYTATKLNNGIIVYIGGWEFGNDGKPVYVQMNKISLFSSKTNLWMGFVNATGDGIGSRRGHQAVLTRDDRIIVYGGVIDGNIDDTWVSATPTLAMLDTRKGVFRWSIPQTFSKSPPPLLYFTSIVIGDFMLIAFGNITNPNTNPIMTSSDLYLLDTRNLAWVDDFVPPPEPGGLTQEKIIIIASVITGVVVLTVLVIIGVCYFRRRRVKKGKDSKVGKENMRDASNDSSDENNGVIPTPGSEQHNRHENLGRIDSYKDEAYDVRDSRYYNQRESRQYGYRNTSGSTSPIGGFGYGGGESRQFDYRSSSGSTSPIGGFSYGGGESGEYNYRNISGSTSPIGGFSYGGGESGQYRSTSGSTTSPIGYGGSYSNHYQSPIYRNPNDTSPVVPPTSYIPQGSYEQTYPRTSSTDYNPYNYPPDMSRPTSSNTPSSMTSTDRSSTPLTSNPIPYTTGTRNRNVSPTSGDGYYTDGTRPDSYFGRISRRLGSIGGGNNNRRNRNPSTTTNTTTNTTNSYASSRGSDSRIISSHGGSSGDPYSIYGHQNENIYPNYNQNVRY